MFPVRCYQSHCRHTREASLANEEIQNAFINGRKTTPPAGHPTTRALVGGPPPGRCRSLCIVPKIAARAPLLRGGGGRHLSQWLEQAQRFSLAIQSKIIYSLRRHLAPGSMPVIPSLQQVRQRWLFRAVRQTKPGSTHAPPRPRYSAPLQRGACPRRSARHRPGRACRRHCAAPPHP